MARWARQTWLLFFWLLAKASLAMDGCGAALEARAIGHFPPFLHAVGERLQTKAVIVSGGLDLVLPVTATHLGLPRLPHQAYRDQHTVQGQIPQFYALGTWQNQDRQEAAEDAVTARPGEDFAGKRVIDVGAGMSDLVPYLHEHINGGKAVGLTTAVDFWYREGFEVPEAFNRTAMEAFLGRHRPKGYLKAGDALDLTPFPAGAYDYVLSHMLWSEFDDVGREQMLRQGWRLLAEGGELRFASDVLHVADEDGGLEGVVRDVERIFDDESRRSGCYWGGAVLQINTVHQVRAPGRMVAAGLLSRQEDYRFLSYAFPDGLFFDLKQRMNPRNGTALTYEYVSDHHAVLIVAQKHHCRR